MITKFEIPQGKTAIDLSKSSSIRALLSNPKTIRKIGRKSKKFKLLLQEFVTDNEESSVFTFPGTNSPSVLSSPQNLPPEKPTPPPLVISEALVDYTSKWASGDSSTDETRESELSPSIISKCSKITSEHPKMIHNRNSNNSEKKKKKHTKELHHHKTSKSNSRKLFSQQDDASNGFPESEQPRGMEEGVTSQEPINSQSVKSNSEGKRKKKLHSSRQDTPNSSLSENKPSSTIQSLKPSPKPQNKLPVKARRANKRTAEFLSDTTSEEDHNTTTIQTQNLADSTATPKQQHTEEGKQKTPLSEDLSWTKLLPPCKRKRPVNFSNIVQRRCEKPNPTILPTNFEDFLSYRQDYASNRIDPSAPISHSYNFPPQLMSLYEEQERSRLSILKRHAQEREQLQLTFEQELLRVYQRSARATPPPSVCTVISSAGRPHQPNQTPSTPLDPPIQPYDSKLLNGLVQDIYDKFEKLIQNLTARQKMDCDALYFTQVETWDSRVQSVRSESESSIPDS